MENNEDEKDKIKQQNEKKRNELKKSQKLDSRNSNDLDLIFKRGIARGKTVIDNDLRSSKYKLDLLYRKDKEQELLKSIANLEDITKEKIQIAEKIDFKTIPDSIVNTDEYGFIVEESSSDESEKKNYYSEKKVKNEIRKDNKENLLKVNARLEKWNHMLNNFKEYQTVKFYKLKSRTRKGIPDSLRSYVWPKICGVDEFYKKDLYQELDKEPIDKKIEDIIIKDLDRTFPKCSIFKDKYGSGQRKLLRVLSNYSKYNKKVGYIQGMGFICALLLTYMDDVRTFFMLDTLIKKYELEGIYLPDFPELKKKFYVLLNLEKKYIPKSYKILCRDEVYPRCYASEWFICLFARSLEFNILVRIFDTFVLEGFKVIYRYALAFIKMKEEELIEGKNGVDSTFIIMENCLKDINMDELFKIAFGFSLSKKLIENYEKEYDKVKDDKDNEFIAQIS